MQIELDTPPLLVAFDSLLLLQQIMWFWAKAKDKACVWKESDTV